MVTVRDIAKVGEVLDAAVKAGANQVKDLTFAIKDPRPSLRELRKKALADAKEKASDLATEAGMQLGVPVSIEVGDRSFGVYSFAARSVASKGQADAMPIAPGEEELNVTVQVVYGLLKPAK